ncbi:MAG: hypothetical protein J3R72DRAFT_423863 [Linnemannia gamsii]|nr:MAG: hypothetical protein J3R72DRAFT_423863 [Linnemannia gamsii]
MRFSTILASASLAAVASAGTISLAEFSSDNSNTSNPDCFNCAMDTFLRSVPACSRDMLDHINSEIVLNDKGKACLCPISALANKPDSLKSCTGVPAMCSTNFLNYTAEIFGYIGKNNNCTSVGAGASASTSAGNGLVSSDKIVAFGALVAMTAVSHL